MTDAMKEKLKMMICECYDLKPSLAMIVIDNIDSLAKDLSEHGAITRGADDSPLYIRGFETTPFIVNY